MVLQTLQSSIILLQRTSYSLYRDSYTRIPHILPYFFKKRLNILFPSTLVRVIYSWVYDKYI